MSTMKECQVVMLPTNEKANPVNDIILLNGKLRKCIAGGEFRKLLNAGAKSYSILITYKEKIKADDWHYNSDNDSIHQAKRSLGINGAKIIATTDKSLFSIISNGEPNPNDTSQIYLPQPSDSFINKFIEAYNTGNPITKVLVEFEAMNTTIINRTYNDFEPKVDKNNTITIKRIKDSYTKEELINYIYDYHEAFNQKITKDLGRSTIFRTDKWIEQNL